MPWDEITARQEDALKRLRAPFPDGEVELRPVYAGEYDVNDDGGRFIPPEAYQKCPRCGKRHPLPARHLSYVGHARVTRRLNEVDPAWSYEFLATRPDGAPITAGGLWIRLTVCGLTKMGFGDAGGKDGPDAVKEMIGDAIRNAAMRFGCGLDMWMADDEEITYPPVGEDGRAPFAPHLGSRATAAQRRLADTISALHDLGAYDGNEIAESLYAEFGARYYRMNEQTVEAAMEFIDEFFPLSEGQLDGQARMPLEEVEVIRV